jgi:hypothetical protein
MPEHRQADSKNRRRLILVQFSVRGELSTSFHHDNMYYTFGATSIATYYVLHANTNTIALL